MLMNKAAALERLYNVCTSGHRFTINLQSVSLSNSKYDYASQILENWLADSSETTLVSLRIAFVETGNPEHMTFDCVERFRLVDHEECGFSMNRLMRRMMRNCRSYSEKEARQPHETHPTYWNSVSVHGVRGRHWLHERMGINSTHLSILNDHTLSEQSASDIS
jgi:hypothetical protein